METRRIPIAQLRSPKTRITFRINNDGLPGQSFFDLLNSYRNGASIEPIEVATSGEGYVILNGVRRALAALSAGQTFILARVFDAGDVGVPIGESVPLADVRFPFDVRE